MASGSQTARPTPELLERLYRSKRQLHELRAGLPLPQKVADVLALQRIVGPLLARQRRLKPWERPWPIEP